MSAECGQAESKRLADCFGVLMGGARTVVHGKVEQMRCCPVTDGKDILGVLFLNEFAGRGLPATYCEQEPRLLSNTLVMLGKGCRRAGGILGSVCKDKAWGSWSIHAGAVLTHVVHVGFMQDLDQVVARKKRRAATRVQARAIVGVSLEVTAF